MPRFARLFEAATDTLHAYYRTLAESNLDAVMRLWIDEDFVSFIRADGTHLYGLESIRSALAHQFETGQLAVEPLDIRVYDSLGTVVYAIVEAHRVAESSTAVRMVFATYVLVHERGEWRIAHIHSSAMPDAAAGEFAARLRQGQGALH